MSSNNDIPDGTEGLRVANLFRDLEDLVDFSRWPSRNRLLHKEWNTGEMLHDLHFDITAYIQRISIAKGPQETMMIYYLVGSSRGRWEETRSQTHEADP